MKKIEEVNLEKILPSNGPSINEVKKYLEKYSDEKIVIKCGDCNVEFIAFYRNGGHACHYTADHF